MKSGNKLFFFYFGGGALLATILLQAILERGNILWLRIAGAVLVFLSLVLWIIPLAHFKKYGSENNGKLYFEKEALITSGIFSLLRHPQYLAYMTLGAGFSLISQNFIIILTALTSIISFYFFSLNEEKLLTERFGDQYKDYSEKVPRYNLLWGIIKHLIK